MIKKKVILSIIISQKDFIVYQDITFLNSGQKKEHFSHPGKKILKLHGLKILEY